MTGIPGRQRLQLLLSALSGGFCLGLMLAVLAVYKKPYNGNWWWIMAAILVLAIIAPRFLVRAVEWVIEGYRQAEKPGDGQEKRAA